MSKWRSKWWEATKKLNFFPSLYFFLVHFVTELNFKFWISIKYGFLTFVHSWPISRRSFVLFFSLFGSNPHLIILIESWTEPSLDYCVMWPQLGAKFRSPYSAKFPIKCLILAVKNLLSLLHMSRCPFTGTLCVSSESYWILQIDHIEFYKYSTGTYSKPSVWRF